MKLTRRKFFGFLVAGSLSLLLGFEGSCPKRKAPKKRDPLLDTGAFSNIATNSEFNIENIERLIQEFKERQAASVLNNAFTVDIEISHDSI
jgi:hypothetical protein